MAIEKVRQQVLKRDHSICQFPYFEKNEVCASQKKVIVHAIEPTTWVIAKLLDRENAPEQLELLRIIKEISSNPQNAFNYEELFFNVTLLCRILSSLENHIVLCSKHHNLLYEELREMSSEKGRVNWQVFNTLALEQAMQGVVYWNDEYDPFFRDRAQRNRNFAYKQEILKNS